MGPTLDPYGFEPKTAWSPSRAGGESWMSSSDKSRLVCSAVYSTREFNHHYAVQCIPPTSRVAPNRRLSSNPSQSIGRPCDAAAGGHDARFCPFLQGIPRLSHILLLKFQYQLVGNWTMLCQTGWSLTLEGTTMGKKGGGLMPLWIEIKFRIY